MLTRLFSGFVLVVALLTLLSEVSGAQRPKPAGVTALTAVAGGCVAGSVYDFNCDVNHDSQTRIEDIQLVAGHWMQLGTYPTTDSWSLSGNAGTTPGTNFLGTIGSQPLIIKTNGVEAIRVTAGVTQTNAPGNVGIQTASPAAALDVETATNFQAIQGQTTVSQGNGVVGIANTGTSAYAVEGSSSQGYAGRFFGKVQVEGNFHATGTCCALMDHPLDPANKYLSLAAVEGPEEMNIYSGNVTTDQNGDALVTLPDYVEALNRDFRYQLTIMGKEWAQARIENEIKDNRFTIKTDKPNVKVSWQVMGIRNDAYAQTHRMVAEQAKPEAEKGYYLHPDVYGQPDTKSIHWAQKPQEMQALQDQSQAK